MYNKVTSLVICLLFSLCSVSYAQSTLERNAKLASEHFIKKAHRLAADKNYQEAATAYTRSIEIYPTSIAHRMRGAMNLRLNRQAEALADFAASIELEPNNPNHYVVRAVTYQLQGKNEEAIKDYSSAIKLKPNSARWLSNRGLSYMRIKDFDNAIIDLNKSLELWPTYAEALYNRGILRHNNEDFQGAIEDYRSALNLKPSWVDVKRRLDMAKKGIAINLQ